MVKGGKGMVNEYMCERGIGEANNLNRRGAGEIQAEVEVTQTTSNEGNAVRERSQSLIGGHSNIKLSQLVEMTKCKGALYAQVAPELLQSASRL
ncbi:hypothetical protein E2C01_022314 [Portunus trituberculatus]|uniref:Uncharacterized protein n=1 Tax=Portunus trituberculatus TaxID=210409 RepID=A0A5B7E7B2_PORTR|nr:hypothetical protein [Portunus trituberculatus]